MAYCSIEDVMDYIKDSLLNAIIGDSYIEDTEEQKKLVTPYVETAIADAEAEIDGYLNKRYNLPFSEVPTILHKFAKDIAGYNVISRIGIEKDSLESIYLTRYNAAIKFLTGVAEGKIEIGVSKSKETAAHGFSIKSKKRLFNRDTLKGW